MTKPAGSDAAAHAGKDTFKVTYRVIYGDTDRAGVVYYATYLRLFETGRTEYMRQVLGRPYRTMEEDGQLFPVVEAYVRYKCPARYDDLLDIETQVRDVSSWSITFFYRISCENRLIVHGHTKHASTDLKGKLTKLPRGLIEAFG